MNPEGEFYSPKFLQHLVSRYMPFSDLITSLDYECKTNAPVENFHRSLNNVYMPKKLDAS